MAHNDNILNTYLADLAVLNVKVHNMHWNVVGKEFKAIHKMTEKIYTELQEQFDAVAEIMKMQDELPLASLADYLDYTTLDEIDSRDYSVEEVLEILSDDCQKIINVALDVRSEASDNDNFLVANQFEDYIARFSKISWFVKAMLTDGNGIELAEWEEIPEDRDDEDKPRPPKGKKGPKEKRKK